MAIAVVAAGAALAWSLLTSVADRTRPEAVSVSGADDSVAWSASSDLPSLPSVLSVTDADFGGATWFVLDRRGRRVHRVDEAGTLLGSFARHGNGPGELSSPTALAVHRDRVAVADRGFVRLYDFSGAHIADRRHAVVGCFALRIADLESVSQGLLVLATCTSPVQGIMAMVLLAEDGGDLLPRASISPLGHGIVADLSFQPVVSGYPGGFVFGNADADCLGVYDMAARQTGSVCHSWLERVPVSRRQAEALKDQLMPAANAVGARVAVPRRLPPFERVFDLADGRLAYSAPVPVEEGEAGDARIFRLVTRGEADGEQVLLAPPASALFASGESVLAAWEAIDGVRVATYRPGVW